MKCQLCKHDVRETDKFCENCGARIIHEKVINENKICPKCGSLVDSDEKFCHRCGNSLINQASNVTVVKNAFCHICNSRVRETDKFCENCGAKLARFESSNSDVDNDIIASRYNYTKRVQQDNSKSKLALGISLGVLVLTFILGNFFPVIATVISFLAVIFGIIIVIRERTRYAGWSIAVGILALMVGGLNITSDLIAKDYAYASANRVSEIINLELPSVEPSFYKISIVDGEIVQVTLTDYSFNDIIYKLNDQQASNFEELIELNGHFSKEHNNILNEEFGYIMKEGTDVSLVYDLSSKTYNLPDDFDEYEIIVINYDYDENTIQILEISRMVQ